MNNIKQTIEILLRDYEIGHTEYQIKNFIIGSEMHPWHKYCQCLKEIARRHESVGANRKALFLIEAEIKKAEIKKRFLFGRKKKAVELETKKQNRKSMTNTIVQINRELEIFVKLAMELRRAHGFESLNYERRNVLEAEAWIEKARWMICFDMFCFGQPSKPTLEFVCKLPKSIKRELIADMAKLDKGNVENFLIS